MTVKLNNPLMGTETPSIKSKSCSLSFAYVKLNNPLMGTETVFWGNYHSLHFAIIVKLNNPLMGTETKNQHLAHRVLIQKVS